MRTDENGAATLLAQLAERARAVLAGELEPEPVALDPALARLLAEAWRAGATENAG